MNDMAMSPSKADARRKSKQLGMPTGEPEFGQNLDALDDSMTREQALKVVMAEERGQWMQYEN